MAQAVDPKSGARFTFTRARSTHDDVEYRAEIRTEAQVAVYSVRSDAEGAPALRILEGAPPAAWARAHLDALAAQLFRAGPRDGWPRSLRRWRSAPTTLDRRPRFVVLDVDDVVLDMDRSRLAAESAISEPLVAALGPAGGRARAGFSRVYEALRAQLRAPKGVVTDGYSELAARIEGWQRPVLEAGHKVKIFSRETILAVALEDEGLPVDPALVRSVVDLYWRALGDESRVYADASALISSLRARNAAFHLATNSDGFLRLEGAAAFSYDAADAWRRKWERMERALSTIGVREEDVTIGDPVGKPEPGFCVAALERFRARHPELSLEGCLAVGDSLGSDVLPFLGVGVARGAVIVRGEEPPSGFLDGLDRVVLLRTLLELER
ncbi:MAG: hypothetical protein HYV07_16055 [Deltaproteobacteria bacterium]|nr:hypothetical protein [Deltaproteobacteria bacterium]